MPENPNARLETFCDGVFAIALTLLIIDIKIPATEPVNNTHDFWMALKHISPSVFAFMLSFAIILISWVNHHSILKLVNKSSSTFIYSNGFLLLTVVFLPFPTGLMGDYLLTDHSGPAVILYNSTLVFQAIGWILVTGSILKNQLTKNEKAVSIIRQNNAYGYYAVILYSLCAIAATWFPLTIVVITTLIWIFWLMLGITNKQE